MAVNIWLQGTDNRRDQIDQQVRSYNSGAKNGENSGRIKLGRDGQGRGAEKLVFAVMRWWTTIGSGDRNDDIRR